MVFAWLALTRPMSCSTPVPPPTPIVADAPVEETVDRVDDFVWHWPLDGRVTSGFGWRNERHHDGVDISTPPGRPVEAAGPGTVVRAEWYYDYGRLVEIVHPDGRMTRYAHLDEVRVVEGQWVEPKTVIGTVGMTGRVTGPHLHFELVENGEQIDPIALAILFAAPPPVDVPILPPPAPSEPPSMFGSVLAAARIVWSTAL